MDPEYMKPGVVVETMYPRHMPYEFRCQGCDRRDERDSLENARVGAQAHADATGHPVDVVKLKY